MVSVPVDAQIQQNGGTENAVTSPVPAIATLWAVILIQAYTRTAVRTQPSGGESSVTKFVRVIAMFTVVNKTMVCVVAVA